jgi:orotate phosphoribosyltransferase-like protein
MKILWILIDFKLRKRSMVVSTTHVIATQGAPLREILSQEMAKIRRLLQ